MKPEKPKYDPNGDLFETELKNIVNLGHRLCLLRDFIEWDELEKYFAQFFADTGNPAKSVQLMAGLFYLKGLHGITDEQLLSEWVENPYWQYFCGMQYFQHKPPIEASTLSNWRKRIGSKGVKRLLRELERTAVNIGFLKTRDLENVIADTTVQEKAISFPTDSKLYYRMTKQLVKLSRTLGIELRQSYTLKSKEALVQASRYGHAKQYKRMRACVRQLKCYLGRLMRDLERRAQHFGIDYQPLREEFARAKQLFLQKQDDKNKLYSLHAPEVECISKGKANKRYEFGVKVSIVTPLKKAFVLCAEAMHGNPYDGHTLQSSLQEVTELSGIKPKTAVVDQGYKGHGVEEDTAVFITHQKRGITKTIKAWLKRRNAVEPVIGHMKASHSLERNRLKGVMGDKINALLSAIGFNLKQILNYLNYSTA